MAGGNIHEAPQDLATRRQDEERNRRDNERSRREFSPNLRERIWDALTMKDSRRERAIRESCDRASREYWSTHDSSGR